MTGKPTRRVIPIQRDVGDGLDARERATVAAACARLKAEAGSLLPVLHAVQSALGHVPKAAVPMIAGELNLSVAEVHGVISFYHYFRTTPVGRHVVHVCRAEACQAVGATALEAHAKRLLGIDYHGTTADGAVSLEPVYCLGNCALGPSVMVDERLVGRVTTRRFDELMSDCRAPAESS
jgi:formate dehydrogenase subunit gamma